MAFSRIGTRTMTLPSAMVRSARHQFMPRAMRPPASMGGQAVRHRDPQCGEVVGGPGSLPGGVGARSALNSGLSRRREAVLPGLAGDGFIVHRDSYLSVAALGFAHCRRTGQESAARWSGVRIIAAAAGVAARRAGAGADAVARSRLDVARSGRPLSPINSTTTSRPDCEMPTPVACGRRRPTGSGKSTRQPTRRQAGHHTRRPASDDPPSGSGAQPGRHRVVRLRPHPAAPAPITGGTALAGTDDVFRLRLVADDHIPAGLGLLDAPDLTRCPRPIARWPAC